MGGPIQRSEIFRSWGLTDRFRNIDGYARSGQRLCVYETPALNPDERFLWKGKSLGDARTGLWFRLAPPHRITLSFEGELDLARVDELNRATDSMLIARVVELIVDLTRVTFMDSTVIGWLMRTKEEIEGRSGRMRIVAVPEGGLVRLLAVTGLEDQINVDVLRTANELF